MTALPFFQRKVGALPKLGLTPVGSASVAKKRQSCQQQGRQNRGTGIGSLGGELSQG